MIFRRRPDPAAQEFGRRFTPIVAAVDFAQRTLLAAIPTSRHPGMPLRDALGGFTAALDVVESRVLEAGLPEELTEACWGAIRAARTEAERLRSTPPGPTEFELLNMRIGDVLRPLEEFAEIERAMRRR